MSAMAPSEQPREKGARPSRPAGSIGSIRRRDLSSADWRFLLPDLDPSQVLILGVPSRGMLSGISMLARRVVVVGPDEGSLRDLREGIRSRNLAHVRAVPVGRSEALPFPDRTFDLIVLRQADAGSALMAEADLAIEIGRLLAPGGVLYLETRGLGEALRLPHRVARYRKQGLEVLGRFWLVHRKGQIWAALPLGEGSPVARYFFDHVLHGTSRKGRFLGALSTSALGLRLLPWVLSGRGVLLHDASEPTTRGVPFAHLEQAGKEPWLDCAPGRTGFFAKGAYDSNKVTFFRFARSESSPDVIVKMTRTRAYNHRLEAEHRALSQLEDRALVDASSYPRALFFGHHQGLAVLGQKVVDGFPFRTRTTGRSDCPFSRAAVDWILQLGARSSDTGSTTPARMADRFARLLHELGETYRLTPFERSFLEDRLRRMREARCAFPVVFRHGDAGTWNVMVTRDDRIAFLDWEASEPEGPPVWDLFDFLRSFGNWLGRVRGNRDNLSNYENAFLRPGPLCELQIEAVERYCAAVGVERELVEPLFFACWMQRALREAEWNEKSLEHGTYIDLIRLCIRERRAPDLRRLFK